MPTLLLKAVFWSCFVLTAYVYLVYPFLVSGVAKLAGRRFRKLEITPPVSIVISAYNEERTIAAKLENTLSLDYPREKVEIIVGTDGSADRTAEIVRTYVHRGVRLLEFPVNRGKTMVQNDCIAGVSHGIVVFMDAASLCERDALKRLVAGFADPRVGAVAGRVMYTRGRGNLTTESQGMYWRYEQLLKRAEGSLGSLVGVDGPLYAVRRELCTRLEDDMISDLISPLLVIDGGRSVVYEPGAVTYEEPTENPSSEFGTRRRIVTRGFTGLFRHPELVDPRRRPLLAWQIVSHKILRWLVGFYYAGMLASSLLLAGRRPFFLLASTVLAAGPALSLYGLREGGRTNRWYAVPYYFMLVNLAAAFGFIDYLRGRRVISWTPMRQGEEGEP